MFLLIALGLSVFGTVVVLLRHRQPTSEDHGIRAFAKEMDALAPPDDLAGDPRRTSRRRDSQ